ncbi:MAG: condensation domain-containing protein, partial [Gammaproteobacteria bacterium]
DGLSIALINEEHKTSNNKNDNLSYVCFEVEDIQSELTILAQEGCKVRESNSTTPYNTQLFALIDTPIGLVKLIESNNLNEKNNINFVEVGFYIRSVSESINFLSKKLAVDISEKYDMNGKKVLQLKNQYTRIELIKMEQLKEDISMIPYYFRGVNNINVERRRLIKLGYKSSMTDYGHELFIQSPIGLIKIYKCNKFQNINQNLMQLNINDVSAHRINWQRKSQNIRELANELNIGLDSCIFIDDNEIECAEVRQNCPEVMTFCLPKQPEEISGFLQYFSCVHKNNILTDEDHRRTQMYREERNRRQLKISSNNMIDFIKKLAVKVNINSVNTEQLSRLSQLTMRTNQFNAYKKIYNESEIKQYELDNAGTVLVIHVEDNFGQYGLVGSVFYCETMQALNVDQFFLSCRILGRGVEYEILRELGRLAIEKNKEFVRVKFKLNERNHVMKQFLDIIPGHFELEVYVFAASQLLILEIGSTFSDATTLDSNQMDFPVAYTKNNKNEILATRQREHNLREMIIHYRTIDLIHQAIMIQSRKKITHNTSKLTYVAPTTTMEIRLASIWQELLLIESIGRYDNFFQLGGHSLLLMRCIIRISMELNFKISVKSIFENPTLSELASYLENLDKNDRIKFALIQKRPERYKKLAPLSFSQEWLLWLLAKQPSSHSAYNIPVALKLTGALNKSALELAFKNLTACHECLRTKFLYNASEMLQIIEENTNIHFTINEYLKNLPGETQDKFAKSLISKEINKPFDLTMGSLFRITLFSLSDQHHILLMVFHHVIMDGWSIDLLLREVAIFYNNHAQNKSMAILAPSLQYADYAYWQHNYFPQNILEAQKKYWVQYTLQEIADYYHIPTSELSAQVAHVFIQVMGHAMAIPTPNFLWQDLNEKRTDKRMVYAGADVGRLPL